VHLQSCVERFGLAGMMNGPTAPQRRFRDRAFALFPGLLVELGVTPPSSDAERAEERRIIIGGDVLSI